MKSKEGKIICCSNFDEFIKAQEACFSIGMLWCQGREPYTVKDSRDFYGNETTSWLRIDKTNKLLGWAAPSAYDKDKGWTDYEYIKFSTFMRLIKLKKLSTIQSVSCSKLTD